MAKLSPRVTRRATLADLCNLITDGKHGDCIPDETSGYYFLSCKDVRDGKLSYDGARQITAADFVETHRRTRLEPGDILITNSGTIGRMAIAPDAPLTRRTTFQKSVAIVKVDVKKVDRKWLYYYLLAEMDRLSGVAGGTAQKNLLLRDMRAFQVELPERNTQLRVASILSAYDDLIENNTRRIAILEEMARRIYEEWFVRFRFPGHEGVRMVESELGLVPEGWTVDRLDEVAEIKGGKQLEKEDIQAVGTYPVFGGNGIQGFSSRSTHGGFVIAFGRVGAYCGAIHWALHGAWLNNNSSSVVPRQHDALVLQHLVGFNFGPLRGGAAQPFISNGALAGIKLLMPTPAIGEHFCQMVGAMRQLQDGLTRANRNLRTTRDILLPKLISGELDVSALPAPETVAA